MNSTACVLLMKVFKPKKTDPQITREQALNSRPLKNKHVVENRLESGEVLLSYPISPRPWMAAVLRSLGADRGEKGVRRLQLDMLGTSVWDLIDGRRSVRRIIELFSDSHRVLPREAELAVTRFLRDLGRRGLIGLQ